jgi:catechol 2,3-dioxygenase-like lactoylglutathione lyase family enzyme
MACDTPVVLLSGINHVAVLTGDTDRFLEFYGGVFDATHELLQERDDFKLTVVWFVTDVGHILSLFSRDPDGLEAEVCVRNPDARSGVHNPPGTPALRYHPASTAPPERLADSPLEN